MSGATIVTTWEGVKRLSKEYADALPTLDRDGVESGFKCFGLAYLGCEFEPGLMGDSQRDVQAPALMRIMTRLRLARDLELDAEELRQAVSGQ